MIIYKSPSLKERMKQINERIDEEYKIKSMKECIEERTIKLTSSEQIPDIIYNRKLADINITNKYIQEKTGKDKGVVSRLIHAENMQVKTFLELCNVIGLEVYIKGKLYKEE
jgi:ferritin-like protein